MKRLWTFLLAVTMLAILLVPARADILWEPYEDSFFEKHRDEMELVRRWFLANGEEGFVTLWNAPGGKTVATQYENGKELLVYNVYRDWALILLWENSTETYGWTPLSDLSLIYDSISFMEEYADEIRDYGGEFAGYSGPLDLVNTFRYPGAPEVSESLTLENCREEVTGPMPNAISKVFTDEEGLTWGYISYLYGSRDIWFCLDNPSGTDFPVRQVPEIAFIPAQTPVMPAVAYAPYLLVGGVVAVTAGLLFWFYARKRGAHEGV